MPRKCCVPKCKSNYASVISTEGSKSTFSFPKDTNLSQAWLRAIPRKDWVPTKHSVVCSNHFSTHQIQTEEIVTGSDGRMFKQQLKYPRLVEGAIPYIFSNIPSDTSTCTRPPRNKPEKRELAEQSHEEQVSTGKSGLSADTRNKHTTISGNTPAQHRLHPVTYQSSGVTGGGPKDPSLSTGQYSQKRDRPDETTPPREEYKRRRTDRLTHQAGSYVRAAKSHLDVAVMLVPRVNMTQQEASSIQSLIQREIFAACLKPPTPGTAPYAPSFEGRAFLSEGVLKLWCSDEQALSWLQDVVSRLKSPRAGTSLALVDQDQIPVRVRSALFVPNYDEDIGELHQILSLQNPWYEVSSWTLYTYQRLHGRTPGVFLVLGIPKEQIDNILARGRKISYSTGTIYIRFFTKKGVSDLPPKDTPKPEMLTCMVTDEPTNETDTKTAQTDTPTGPRTDEPSVGTSGPSLSSVLENIDAILTEELSTPPSNTPWRETRESDSTDTTALTIKELLEKMVP